MLDGFPQLTLLDLCTWNRDDENQDMVVDLVLDLPSLETLEMCFEAGLVNKCIFRCSQLVSVSIAHGDQERDRATRFMPQSVMAQLETFSGSVRFR